MLFSRVIESARSGAPIEAKTQKIRPVPAKSICPSGHKALRLPAYFLVHCPSARPRKHTISKAGELK